MFLKVYKYHHRTGVECDCMLGYSIKVHTKLVGVGVGDWYEIACGMFQY